MAKLIIFLFAALIAIASATTTYTTVVTTTSTSTSASSCEREMQGKRMNHCQMWMMQGCRQDEVSFLRTAVANPRYQEEEEEHLEECCNQLKSISSECQCDAIRRMVMDMQQKKGMEEMMMEKMKMKAESLPKMCGMHTLQCRIRAVYF